jgi:hypothetical protein
MTIPWPFLDSKSTLQQASGKDFPSHKIKDVEKPSSSLFWLQEVAMGGEARLRQESGNSSGTGDP